MQYSKNEAAQALEKLMDLKKTFEFGSKMVPVIQNISNFLREVLPLLKTINYSIAESASKMPVASNQINNVTSATELATNEILDLIDAATNSLMEIETCVGGVKEKLATKDEDFNKLSDIVKDSPEALEIVERLRDAYDLKETETKVADLISDINDKNFKVTMSLQVQDITSQQLNAVQELIKSVQTKLHTLIGEIDKTEVSKEFNEMEFDTALPESEEYNPHATYAKDDRQESADDIINEFNDQVSQDDIDNLFK
ncbi:MAG: protein phosphatase CheZ [Melioribacteraceae bacterium]|nr:protein phosphatase CheZ [Melioribacteraceae bacterium]